jgi:hypothetical protein
VFAAGGGDDEVEHVFAHLFDGLGAGMMGPVSKSMRSGMRRARSVLVEILRAGQTNLSARAEVTQRSLRLGSTPQGSGNSLRTGATPWAARRSAVWPMAGLAGWAWRLGATVGQE